MRVTSKAAAWERANAIFPTDYAKDEDSSNRAGYPIYRSTADDHYYDYICDLGCRLEVNLSSGESINIFIDVPDEVAELKKEIERLKAALEKEQCWVPHESDENVKQADYESLATAGGTRVLTNEEAVDLIAGEFGFDRYKVTILHSVDKEEINRHRQCRKVGEIDRDPVYNATDWNYIRFDCAGWCYEMHNGSLSQYYC